MGHEGTAPMRRPLCPYRRKRASPPSFSDLLHVRVQEHAACKHKAGSPNTGSASTFILDFPAFRTVRNCENKHLFDSPSL